MHNFICLGLFQLYFSLRSQNIKFASSVGLWRNINLMTRHITSHHPSFTTDVRFVVVVFIIRLILERGFLFQGFQKRRMFVLYILISPETYQENNLSRMHKYCFIRQDFSGKTKPRKCFYITSSDLNPRFVQCFAYDTVLHQIYLFLGMCSMMVKNSNKIP